MKRLLSIGIFVVAISASFAFKSITATDPEDLNCKWFYFNTAGNPFNPSDYIEVPIGDVPTIRTVACPDDLELCAICVPEDEIYTSGDFEGLPKVDDDVTPSHIFELLDETTGDVEEDNPGITDPDWAIERFED